MILNSSESGFVKREKKSGLLMHASIPTSYISLVFLCVLSFSLFFLSTSHSFCSICPPSPYIHCSQLPFFIPSVMVGLTIFTPQLLLASYGCPFRTTDWLAGCPATTSAKSVLVAPLSIPKQNYLSCFLPLSVFTSLIRIRIKLPHLILTSFRWDAIPARHFSQRSLSGNPIIDHFFSSLQNHTFWKPWPMAHLSCIGWV